MTGEKEIFSGKSLQEVFLLFILRSFYLFSDEAIVDICISTLPNRLKYNLLISCTVFFISLCACQKEIKGESVTAAATTTFDSIPVAKIVNPIINEASGMAASKINPGYIWVQEDSGNPPQLKLTFCKRQYTEKNIYQKYQ